MGLSQLLDRSMSGSSNHGYMNFLHFLGRLIFSKCNFWSNYFPGVSFVPEDDFYLIFGVTFHKLTKKTFFNKCFQ